MASDLNQVHLRLGDVTAKLVDKYARYVKEATGVEPSRADAALALVRRALAAWDAEVTTKGKK